MARSAFSLRRFLVGAIVPAVVLLAWPGPGAAAGAGDAVTIPLDPAYVEVSFPSEQNVGTAHVEIPQRAGEFSYVEARWGGDLTITMPPQKVDTGHVGAALTLETAEGTHTGAYSTDPAAPAAARLSMTTLGSNRYRLRLPADDGTNGPVGRLQVSGLQLRPGLDVVQLDPPNFVLHLSPQGPASAEVDQQTVAVSCPPGRPETAGCAPVPPLPAGAGITVTLPIGSRLRALGLSGLRDAAFALQPRDPQHWPSALPGTALPARVGTSDGATTTMTVPLGTTPGPYQFTAVVADTTGQLVCITAIDVDVVAAAPSSGAAASSAAPAQGGGGKGGLSRGQIGMLAVVGAVTVLALGAAVAVVQHRRHHRHRSA